MNSATIRVPKRDKQRLERLAKKIGNRKLSEAFRFALSVAERDTDTFQGNIEALVKRRNSVRAVGGKVSEKVDDILAGSIYDEGRRMHD
jgi:hypothetical protein